MKSLMNRYVKLLSFLPGICLIVACTGHQIKGYEINGSTPLPEFEGKMVYMKDFSSGQLVDSAEIVHGQIAAQRLTAPFFRRNFNGNPA